VSECLDIVPLALGTRLTLKAGCVLIRDGATRVLVDPGCFAGRAQLDAALHERAGVGLADVDLVFFTHLHFDHYNDLGFADVPRVVMPRREAEEVAILAGLRGDVPAYREHIRNSHHQVSSIFMRQFVALMDDRRYALDQVSFRRQLEFAEPGDVLTPNLRVIDLAGHSIGQLGLALRTRWGLTAVAADAVLSAEDYAAQGIDHHLVVHDREALLRSRARLGGFDCIVPGHGAWFVPRTGQAVHCELEALHV
jgi:glyoxylase-like metal-dependent hydrolase (beta-lactamase superfamily II)